MANKVENTAGLLDHQPKILVEEGRPLVLESGLSIAPVPVAYQTYGRLNDDKSNAILVCHALTGDQYVAGKHPITGRLGWWNHLVGPGLTLDTDNYFIICVNVLGGCMGSYGPATIDSNTGEQYGLGFPVVTIGDMVEAQARVIDALGIQKHFSVVGGSMGGMQVLEWASRFPDRVFSAIPIAAAGRHTAQNIAFHEVGRQAIMSDPDWCDGSYAKVDKRPRQGLAVARMTAHITYLSEAAFHRKFGRMLQDSSQITYGFDAEFQVESYLRHQGSTFVDRFDANSYLYITRAMDYFDLAATNDGSLAKAFENTEVRFCVIAFTSDWLFPVSESQEVVKALNANAANVSFCEIETDKGHDSFLLDEPEFFDVLNGFLRGASKHRGLPSR